MTADLSGLQRAAERFGLPGLQARLVPPDRRRSRWFRWTERELLVNERVIERLTPAEGEALLAHAIVERRRLDVVNRRILIIALVGLVLVSALAIVSPALRGVGTGAWIVAVLGGLGGRARARELADDEAIELLGEPETLIRAMNRIHQDELRVGGKAINARPDIHRRCERLVTKHQLRLPPEMRHGSAGPGDG